MTEAWLNSQIAEIRREAREECARCREEGRLARWVPLW